MVECGGLETGTATVPGFESSPSATLFRTLNFGSLH